MAIVKVELDAAPKPYEIVGVVKTNYRSGARFEISVRFSWKITPVGAKFQCYTGTVTLPWDRAAESVDDLKAKAKAAFDALKTADTSEADLIFSLERLTL